MKKKITLLIALSGVFIFGIVHGDCKMPDTINSCVAFLNDKI